MAKKKKYTEAINELQSIIHDLEQAEDFNMDDVSKKVKQASELLAMCRKQLHEMDEDLEKLMENLE